MNECQPIFKICFPFVLCIFSFELDNILVHYFTSLIFTAFEHFIFLMVTQGATTLNFTSQHTPDGNFAPGPLALPLLGVTIII